MDFLLSKGLTNRWVVGNSVVSVTTSGTYIDVDGICENCLSLHKRVRPDSSSTSVDSNLLSRRRRSREKLLDDMTLKAKNDEKPTGDISTSKHVTTERSKTPEPRESPVATTPEGQKGRTSDRAMHGKEC